jgi:hypothetical protein
MLAAMTARQIAEWWAYYCIEPWGPEQEWMRAGIIAATVANCAGGKKRGGGAFKPSDFMPPPVGPVEMPKNQSVAEMRAMLEQIAGKPIKRNSRG